MDQGIGRGRRGKDGKGTTPPPKKKPPTSPYPPRTPCLPPFQLKGEACMQSYRLTPFFLTKILFRMIKDNFVIILDECYIIIWTLVIILLSLFQYY